MVERRLSRQTEGMLYGGSIQGERSLGSNRIKEKVLHIFNRRKSDVGADPTPPGASDRQLHATDSRGKEGREHENPEMLRPLTPEDVQTMIDEGWFEDWNRIKGLKGDAINEDTYPQVWNDETRTKFKDEVLMPFYFPPEGRVHIVATDENGNFIREIDVERQSYAFTWKGKLKASRSFLSNDAWASESDFNNPKFKIAHAQMLITAPGKENGHKGFATGLCAYFHEEVFDRQHYTNLITWVNREEIDYGLQEQMFEKMGYEEDRKIKGKLTLNPTDPTRRTKMRKYWLTPKKLKENLITQDNTWLRWEKKKGNLMLEEERQASR